MKAKTMLISSLLAIGIAAGAGGRSLSSAAPEWGRDPDGVRE